MQIDTKVEGRLSVRYTKVVCRVKNMWRCWITYLEGSYWMNIKNELNDVIIVGEIEQQPSKIAKKHRKSINQAMEQFRQLIIDKIDGKVGEC